MRVGTVLSRKLGRAVSGKTGLAVVISGPQGPWASLEPPVTKVAVLGHPFSPLHLLPAHGNPEILVGKREVSNSFWSQEKRSPSSTPGEIEAQRMREPGLEARFSISQPRATFSDHKTHPSLQTDRAESQPGIGLKAHWVWVSVSVMWLWNCPSP